MKIFAAALAGMLSVAAPAGACELTDWRWSYNDLVGMIVIEGMLADVPVGTRITIAGFDGDTFIGRDYSFTDSIGSFQIAITNATRPAGNELRIRYGCE